jgi:deazaflavin-dependent oxidoreductase (nitroreductase family)
MTTPSRQRLKRRASRFVTVRMVNPLVRLGLEHARVPSLALLETTGRRSGAARRVPVGDGLRGDTFWIVTEHGRSASYVKNIEANPQVRVKARGRWRTGTATVLSDDDPRARMRMLRRPANDTMVRLVGTEHLTIRIDLDPA